MVLKRDFEAAGLSAGYSEVVLYLKQTLCHKTESFPVSVLPWQAL